jgi:aryl-alcohol dehydrogenase-like predicted oxidoreductase
MEAWTVGLLGLGDLLGLCVLTVVERFVFCRWDVIDRAVQPALAMGVLTGKNRPGDRPKGIRRFDRSFRRDGLEKVQPVVALLGEIGDGYSKSPAQVALRWLIEESVLPIPGAKNGRQAASNAQALSFSLVGAEIEALDQATAAWRR